MKEERKDGQRSGRLARVGWRTETGREIKACVSA